MKWWKRELLIFIGLFFILALGMHFQAWVDHPLTQIRELPNSPLGPWHPLYLTLLAYLLLWAVRLLFRGIKKIFTRG